MGNRDSVEDFVQVITGRSFIKSVTYGEELKKLFVHFYNSYEEYKEHNPDTLHKNEDYNLYFGTGAEIEKIIVEESARLLRDFEDLETISMTLHFQGKTYNSNIHRFELNAEIGFNIEDTKEDIDDWRNRFLNVYSSKLKCEKRSYLFNKFTTIQ